MYFHCHRDLYVSLAPQERLQGFAHCTQLLTLRIGVNESQPLMRNEDTHEPWVPGNHFAFLFQQLVRPRWAFHLKKLPGGYHIHGKLPSHAGYDVVGLQSLIKRRVNLGTAGTTHNRPASAKSTQTVQL